MSEEVSGALARDHRLEAAALWPPCPSHAHSLDPTVAQERAVWQCRDDHTIQFAIGSLRELDREPVDPRR